MVTTDMLALHHFNLFIYYDYDLFFIKRKNVRFDLSVYSLSTLL